MLIPLVISERLEALLQGMVIRLLKRPMNRLYKYLLCTDDRLLASELRASFKCPGTVAYLKETK
jgi:hypothetical protein